MIKTGDSNRRLGIVLMVLAVLVGGITATGYADQLSGPAVVGTLTLVQVDAEHLQVRFDNVRCRGNVVTFAPTELLTGILPTTAASLKDFPLPGFGLSLCPGQNDQTLPSNNLKVKAVVPSKFEPITNGIMAEVVLLFVL